MSYYCQCIHLSVSDGGFVRVVFFEVVACRHFQYQLVGSVLAFACCGGKFFGVSTGFGIVGYLSHELGKRDVCVGYFHGLHCHTLRIAFVNTDEREFCTFSQCHCCVCCCFGCHEAVAECVGTGVFVCCRIVFRSATREKCQ